MSSVATLRFIKHANIEPSQKSQARQETFGNRVNVDQLPTLKDLYGKNPCYTEAVDCLTELLRKSPEACRFLDFDPKRQKILKEIGSVRIADFAFEKMGLRFRFGL